MNLFDSHAHVQHRYFDEDRDDVIERAKEAGLSMILNLTTSFEDAQAVIDLAEQHDFCYAAVGTHPCDVHLWKPEHEAEFLRLSEHPKVLMIGEIGLDFFHKPFDADLQKKVLRRHLAMARETGLPVSLHCRGEGCYEELLRVLKEEKAEEFGGIAHCFVGEEDQAREFLDMGFYLGVGGIATYPKSEEMRQMLGRLDRSRLLMETDSPFLAPKTRRGKRNEPAFVAEIAKALADILDPAVTFPFHK